MKPALINSRLVCCLIGVLSSSGLYAAGQVSSVTVSEQSATPFTYSVDGIEYNWGRGNNQLIEGFSADGHSFGFASSANEVVIQRDDISGVATGEPCGVFVERLSMNEQSRTFAADFPSDGSLLNNCQLDLALESRIINRGVVDVFSNTLPDAKNIERLDYLFYSGTLAPLTESQLSLAGHLVAEKGGNNPVKVAAVLSLDIFGQPAEYGPLVLVSEMGCSDPALCFGSTDLVHSYSFLQNEYNAPQSLPAETEQTVEVVNMAFVSTSDLGLQPGQLYFGMSFFADDVVADIHNLVDPSTFPDDTSDDYIVVGDDADIYGGLTGYFLADEINTAGGKLFLDTDQDGMPDADEAGISDVTLSLYTDANGDGLLDPASDTQLGDSLSSNIDGSFVFPGLPDGNFLIVVDEADAEIPAGLIVTPGTNPYPLTIAGIDSDPVYFSFVTPSNTGPGSNDGSNAPLDDQAGGSDGGTGDGSDGGTGDSSDGGTGDGADGGTGDGSDGGTGDGSDGGTGDGSDGGTGDGSDGGTGDGSDGGTGDGSDGGTGDGSDGGTGDGSDGGTGDGSDGGTGDGSDGGTGDGSDGGTGDGSDGGTGDGSDGGTGDGSDGGTGDGSDGGTGDGSDGGTGDGSDGGTGDGSDGGTGDGSDGGTGDGSDGGTGDGSDGGTGDGSDGGTGDGSNDDGLNADVSTSAEADNFDVNQGQSRTLPVLLNDFDGAGGGLTLVSVSESRNASISITDNNEVLYDPNDGYYSPEGEPDTFLYTMQDADGTVRSASVSATVIRYVDLDGDGVNDFTQCNDCTDLYLETGVNGAGIGNVSRFTLLLMILMLFWRVFASLSMMHSVRKGGM